MAARKKSINFEQSIDELESLVESLESGTLTLEDSLKAFEKGVRITRECQDALKEAEQKISLLSQDSQGAISSTTFDQQEEN
ncbi:MAG: exodeoxyribonuclease VII small subunit [Porticoccaceae bacterium]